MNNLIRKTSRVNLSELIVCRTLVNGKVVVINDDNSYTLYKPFPNVDLTDNFDPTNYDLCRADFYALVHKYERKYSPELKEWVNVIMDTEEVFQFTTHRVGIATSENRRKAKANAEYQLVLKAIEKHNAEKPKLYPGDKIHIKSRRGVYEVLSTTDTHIKITCKRWQYHPIKFSLIEWKDFQCKAGGLFNRHFV